MFKNLFLFFQILAFMVIVNITNGQKVKFDELPEGTQELVKSKYKKYTVNSIEKETRENVIFYTVEVQKKNTGYQLEFDADGTLVSKTKFKSFSFDGTETPVDRSGAETSPVPPI